LALPLLIQQSKDLNTQIGENIVAELNQQFKQAEALTKDLANLSESLPKESNIIHRVVPHLLDMESMRNVIAGGGIWPEPFQFDPARERSSFFWGRNTDTQLKFYNKGSWGFSVLKRHNPLQPPWLLASSGVLTSS
jgi:hypothetical protein